MKDEPQNTNIDLKAKTANTLMWNTIDRISTQILYAVTGIVLAQVLMPEDFGLIGAITIFTAFANLFIDSGFSSALIQKKNVTQTDFSTIFFFNIGISVILYILLWFTAPLIADIFHDKRLITLSRVMFLNFIILAFGMVQSTKLMKKMDVKIIAISNSIGLFLSGALALIMALNGYGAWAMVAQALVLSSVKSAILWKFNSWRPSWTFSKKSLSEIFQIGSGVMMTSLFNTIFLNIYSFIIGSFYNLKHLGYYTQADKWSKMGITALGQILGSSFLPILADMQDNRERLHRAISKMNKLTSFIIFPIYAGLIIVAEPLFRTLFGNKWDASILLFQLLIFRGIFTTLTVFLNNCILGIGKVKIMLYLEIVKDILSLIAIFITLEMGVTILVLGQVFVSILHYLLMAYISGKVVGYGIKKQVKDMIPYCAITIIISIPLVLLPIIIDKEWLLLILQTLTGVLLYYVINKSLNSHILQDILEYAKSRINKNKQ